MGLVVVIYEEKRKVVQWAKCKGREGKKKYQKRIFLGNEHKKIKD